MDFQLSLEPQNDINDLLYLSFLYSSLTLGRHVKRHISFHVHLAALSESGAGDPRVGGCSTSVGSKKSHDQGPAASGPQASSQAAAPPGGPGPSTAGPVQRHSHPQHLHVWGYERSVCSAEGPCDGQRPDGDSA